MCKFALSNINTTPTKKTHKKAKTTAAATIFGKNQATNDPCALFFGSQHIFSIKCSKTIFEWALTVVLVFTAVVI